MDIEITETSLPTQEKIKAKGNPPDFRIVQPTTDRAGKNSLEPVGAMWKNVSAKGGEFYSLKIGKLKLLVFPNNSRH